MNSVIQHRNNQVILIGLAKKLRKPACCDKKWDKIGIMLLLKTREI